MTTLIDWPTTIPQQFLVDGYEEEGQDVLLRTEMDAAISKQRPRYSNAVSPVKGDMLMSEAELVIFEAFFRTDLRNGAYEFNMPILGDNNTTRVMRFVQGTYRKRYIGPKWRVSMNLEIIP